MAEQGQEQDRSEPATPFKLHKAHERGSVAQSAEVTFAFVLFVGIACVHGLSRQAVRDTEILFKQAFAFVGREQLTATTAISYIGALGSRASSAVMSIVFAIWIGAVLVAALQAQGVFSTQPLQPDFSRLNPAVGFRRLFSVKSLHELWRTAAKIAAIALVMVAWGRQHMSDILHASGTPRTMLDRGIRLLGSELAVLAFVVLVFALLDWSIVRWEYMRNLRMSKREIKDEHREREGDPRIKSRLRQLRLQWLQRARQLAKVRNADVLLTNPTHYAIALEYRHGEMPAPMITARGAGQLAHTMRAEARRRGVPVVEHPPLARALFATGDALTYVPEEHFEQVARILRWVYAARRSRVGGGVSA